MNSKTIAVALVALIAALLCASEAAAASSRKLLFPHPFAHHPFLAHHHGGSHPLAHKVLDKLGFREGEFKAGRIVHGIGRLAEGAGVAVGAYGLATGDQNAKNIGRGRHGRRHRHRHGGRRPRRELHPPPRQDRLMGFHRGPSF